jgi:hypothetical protein
VSRDRAPGAGGPDHVAVELDHAHLREGAECRARERLGVGLQACRERRGPHPAVLAQHVQRADAKRGGQRPCSGVKAAPDSIGVEAHSDDVGDALGRRNLTDHQMRAAAGHEPAHLARDELGHVRFPAEPVAFAFGCWRRRRVGRGGQQHT